jgi:hypothetical protein
VIMMHFPSCRRRPYYRIPSPSGRGPAPAAGADAEEDGEIAT